MSIIIWIVVLNVYNTFIHLDRDCICWSTGRLLELDDFQGVPDSTTTHYGTKASAISSIELQYLFRKLPDNPIPEIIVVNSFNRIKSWAIVKNEAMLIHEQLHFDISELHARKIRSLVKEYLMDNDSIDVYKLKTSIDEQMVQMEDMQNQFDIETLHGVVEISQLKWRSKVDKELGKFSRYSSTLSDCQDGSP